MLNNLFVVTNKYIVIKPRDLFCCRSYADNIEPNTLFLCVVYDINSNVLHCNIDVNNQHPAELKYAINILLLFRTVIFHIERMQSIFADRILLFQLNIWATVWVGGGWLTQLCSGWGERWVAHSAVQLVGRTVRSSLNNNIIIINYNISLRFNYFRSVLWWIVKVCLNVVAILF